MTRGVRRFRKQSREINGQSHYIVTKYLVGLNPALPSEFQLIFLLGFEIPTAFCVLEHATFTFLIKSMFQKKFMQHFKYVLLESEINVPLHLLTFGIFSRGYGVITESSFKGVISKPSGDCIVGPNFCFWS